MIYILLPAYNEKKNLVKIFKKIEKLPNTKTNISVVLVDDFSTDNTDQLLKKKYKFKLSYIRHKKNKGLSITMETGFRKIIKSAKKKDIIVTLDSDNTHPISVIDKMVKKINDSNDIVVASRFAPGSKVNGVSAWRHFLSTGAKFLFKFLYPFRNLNDYTCNFRAYKSELIKELLRNKTFFKNEDFIIAGKIIGNVTCYDYLELQPGSTIKGNIEYNSLEIHAGAIVNGLLKQITKAQMKKEQKKVPLKKNKVMGEKNDI